jgi:hypothetical protein
VISNDGFNGCLHALGHEVLRFGIDHSVFFGNQKPGRPALPKRLWRRLLNALDGNGPLHRLAQRQLLLGAAVRKCIGNPSSGIQMKPECVGGKFRRFWVRLVLVKHLSDRFTFIRGQRRNIDQPFDALVVDRRDNGAGIGVAASRTGPFVLASARFSAAASSLRDVRGIGAAITFNPSFSSGRMTLLQLDPSAQAPCTRSPSHSVEISSPISLGEKLPDALGNERAVVLQAKCPVSIK